MLVCVSTYVMPQEEYTNHHSGLGVANQSLTSDCSVTLGRCWPSAAQWQSSRVICTQRYQFDFYTNLLEFAQRECPNILVLHGFIAGVNVDGHAPSGLRAPSSADRVEALDKIHPLRLVWYTKRFPPHLWSVKRSKGKPSRGTK